MANDHPFQFLFETSGRPSPYHAELVNLRAFGALSEALNVAMEQPGRCILLRAPRAGHGKTHLISRVQTALGATHEFIPLHSSYGAGIHSVSVMDDVLRRLVRPLPASGGLCVLDVFTRRLFASALQPLVGSGEVPCQDRDGALAALRMRPIETFDFHHAQAVTAHWARENFEVLGQRLSLELAGRCGLPVREISFWVDTLFRFAATAVENPGRVRTLGESVQGGNPDEGTSMERLEALLGLISQLTRVVLVADDLEGFSADEGAALKFAAFLGALRQSVERVDVVLSLNRDIWESAFLPRLSGGLADRLSEIVIDLTPLNDVEMAALLDSRTPGLGSRVLEHVNLAEAGTHARGVIRAAGVAWVNASRRGAARVAEEQQAAVVAVQAAAVVAPVVMPEPVIEEVVLPPAVPEVTSVVAGEAEMPEAWPAPVFTPAVESTSAIVTEEEVSTKVDSPFQIAMETGESEGLESADAPASGAQIPAGAAQAEDLVEDRSDSPFRVATDADGSPVSAALEVETHGSEVPVTNEVSVFHAPPGTVFQTPVLETPPQPSFGSEAGGEAVEAVGATLDMPAVEPGELHPADVAFDPAALEIKAQPSAAAVPDIAEATDSDRVDELLRQFRERYGRGSL